MLESDVCLLRDLISLHPIHGGSSRSASQFEAARIIYERLVTDGWDEVLFDDYFSRELASHPLFVDTVAFGPDFSRDPHIQKRNVIARVDSGKLGPCLILNGHFDVDVVSTPEAWRRPDFWLSAERCGDQIYGRGSSDMLGGLVGLLAASKAFLTENKDWTGSLVFMAVVDEEIGGNGTLHAIEQCIKMGWIQPSASCLIAEPSDRQVCNASLGFAAFDLTFTRSTCHMGASSGAESAMRDFVMCLQTLDQDLRHAANLSGLILEDVAPIANVGVVSGGIDPSIPLGLLTARGVLFYPPSVNRDLFLKEAATAISQRFPNTLHFFLEPSVSMGRGLRAVPS